MNRGGIQMESNATRIGIAADASCARAPAPANPTRPVVVGSPTVDPLPHLPSLADTSSNDARDRLSDLERATVADAELIHVCRWKAQAARQRIANRRAEIERLRGAA